MKRNLGEIRNSLLPKSKPPIYHRFSDCLGTILDDGPIAGQPDEKAGQRVGDTRQVNHERMFELLHEEGISVLEHIATNSKQDHIACLS
jgi:hypothetical protein